MSQEGSAALSRDLGFLSFQGLAGLSGFAVVGMGQVRKAIEEVEL